MLPLTEPEEQRRRWGAQGGRSGSSLSPGRFIRRNHATHCSNTSCTWGEEAEEEGEEEDEEAQEDGEEAEEDGEEDGEEAEEDGEEAVEDGEEAEEDVRKQRKTVRKQRKRMRKQRKTRGGGGPRQGRPIKVPEAEKMVGFNCAPGREDTYPDGIAFKPWSY
ncbi:hypothetical protein EYF80_047147 [Liparis tanakae]|uniref:Uncharacterized protein n=1 Tax=Liparis tanakae TaxID=230148 RepID=A0A4Z2FP64_9TELE|nr:hypothetical protein EYF80_047147 [Liparis tanakae]